MAIGEVDRPPASAGGFLVVGDVEVSFGGYATSGSAYRPKGKPV